MQAFDGRSDEHQALGSGTPHPRVLEAGAPYGYGVSEKLAGIDECWQVLIRRRWTVIVAVFLVTAVVAVITFRMKPVCRGSARVEVDAEMPTLQSISELSAQTPPGPDEDFLHSQAQVLQSDQLAWQTIEQLDLAKMPSFASAQTENENPEIRKRNLIDRFAGALHVELLPSSRIIRVDFEDTDPQLAAKAANALVRNYIEFNFTEKYNATREASGRMEQQLGDLKAKVEQSQQALVDYQRRHALANVNDKQNVVEQRLSELSTELSKAESDRIEKQSIEDLLRSDPEQIASVAQNQLLQRLQEKYADLSNQYTEALNQYGPKFPKVVRLQSQLADAEAQINNERQRVFKKIHNDYVAAVAREKLLSQEVARQKEELGKVNDLLVQQNILTGEFETNQKMYQNLMQRLKDATISAGLRTTNIHLIDPAIRPVSPVRPRKLLYICSAALIGLVLGVVLVFVEDNLDNSLRTADEAEMVLGAPALAAVPVAEESSRRRSLPIGRRPLIGETSAAALAVVRQPQSPLAESFRTLRTSFLVRAQEDCRTVLITSPGTGDGKTSTAVNLAMSLGQRRQSVVLVDCDLRKPCVGRILGADNGTGLTSLLGFGEQRNRKPA